MSTASTELTNVKVSVHMITYNHEAFIAQAIEGVLMQQTDFEYELVIGEDCSTDGTRAIVRDYGERYPERIRLLLPESNQGARANAIATAEACRGQYIAYCEGDDYWTDPFKLQKQVDFLEVHPDYAICFHSVTIIDEDKRKEPWVFPELTHPATSQLEDLLKQNFIPTCSTVFRNRLFGELPKWYYELLAGDWPLHILNAQHGKIGYINVVMGAYRIHSGSVWSSLDKARQLRANIELWGHINSYMNFKYENIIGEAVSNHWGSVAAVLVAQAAEQGCAPEAASKALEQFDRWSIQSTLSDAWKARSLGKIYAGLLFAGYEARAFALVRHYWLKAIRSDPLLLRNRGVWSIGVEAFVGQRAAGFLRKSVGAAR